MCVADSGFKRNIAKVHRRRKPIPIWVAKNHFMASFWTPG